MEVVICIALAELLSIRKLGTSLATPGPYSAGKLWRIGPGLQPPGEKWIRNGNIRAVAICNLVHKKEGEYYTST